MKTRSYLAIGASALVLAGAGLYSAKEPIRGLWNDLRQIVYSQDMVQHMDAHNTKSNGLLSQLQSIPKSDPRYQEIRDQLMKVRGEEFDQEINARQIEYYKRFGNKR